MAEGLDTEQRSSDPRGGAVASASVTSEGASLGDVDPAVASPFAVGSVIDGKYAVEAAIAQGGIGVIVRATHVGLGQPVAIKYLRPDVLANAAIVGRFEREARLAAKISSEHVVRVQDVGVVPGFGPYMVMEYLVGRDLGSIAGEGAVPIVRAVDYLLQACDALAEAHAVGIVHRDIKPENMFLAQRTSNSAIVKIIDFGISKVSPKRGDGSTWAHDTGRAERIGTPLYMSPEQLQSSGNVDQRTDIWSLGAVLFELLTTSSPFRATDLPELCGNILGAAPTPLRELMPEAPAELEAVILKCLEKEPSNRFRNVAELAQELAPFGPSNASTRVSRIRSVVRRGGHSVRPPTPFAFPVHGLSLPPNPAATSVTYGHTQATTVRLPRPDRRARWVPLAFATLGALVVVGGVFALLLHGTPSPPSSAALEAPAVAAVGPAPNATPTTTPSGEPVVASSAPPAPLAPSTATSSLKVRPSATPPPRSDRRSLFGDRK